MAAIIQQDAWKNSNGVLPWSQEIFVQGFNKPVTEGSAVVVFWSGGNGSPLESIEDNYGNEYAQIPGASLNNFDSGWDGEFWWAQNVPATTIDTPLELTFTYSGSGSSAVGFWALEISGINGANLVTGTKEVRDTNDANFSGISLDGGSGAVYLTGLAGTFDYEATVSAPWSVYPSLQELGAPTIAALTLTSSGVQTATFSPEPSPGWFIGVVCGVAFMADLSPTETIEGAILQRASGAIDVAGFRTDVVGVINS